MNKKKIIQDTHSIEDVYNIVSKIELELKEFKLSASKISIQMDTMENELLSLKNNEFPDFIQDVTVTVDEIKDRVDTEFSFQNSKNEKTFKNFETKVSNKLEKFGTKVEHIVGGYMGPVNDSLASINFTLANILEILKKKFSN